MLTLFLLASSCTYLSNLVSEASSTFRKTKIPQWQTVGVPAPSSTDQVAADAILTTTVAECSARKQMNDGEDDPAGVESEEAASILKMDSGAHAGLQSAATVAAQLTRRKVEERKHYAQAGDQVSGKNQETIYRDASGRIINVAMQRAEMRKRAEEEAAKAQAQISTQKGAVQLKEKEKRKEQLEEAKFMKVARYADDEQLNDELKGRNRWDDPAVGFLTQKRERKSVTGKPLYQGPSGPNRYGIRPGHRWDGVDRSNGFEKEWFAAKNKRANMRELEYAWQMDE